MTSVLTHCTPNIVGASLRGRPIIDSLANKLQKPRRWGAHRGTPLQIKAPVLSRTQSYKHAAPPEQSSWAKHVGFAFPLRLSLLFGYAQESLTQDINTAIRITTNEENQ